MSSTFLLYPVYLALAVRLAGADSHGIREHFIDYDEHRSDPRRREHHSSAGIGAAESTGPGRPQALPGAPVETVHSSSRKGGLPLVSDKYVTTQVHTQKSLMRSEADKQSEKRTLLELEVHAAGSITSQKARANPLAPDMVELDAVGGTTRTTTLSSLHLMTSTSAGGLAAPLENTLGSTTQALQRLASTTLEPETAAFSEVNADDVVEERFSLGRAPPTADQVPNNVAAFVVSSAGKSEFNGAYLPSSMPNTKPACTSLSWDMQNAGGRHLLYNMNGAWVLDLEGSTPSYNGQDDGSCSPEKAAWAAIAATAGSAPQVVRATASDYATTTTTTMVISGAAAAAPAVYFVVDNAGIPGFNGVYYTTPLVVANLRCERTYAKDGPDNTEYTLSYGNPNYWFFQSLIGGQTNRAYVGEDDGSCSPENVRYTALNREGGTVPSVVRSATATTTTTSTTTTTTTTIKLTTTRAAWTTPNRTILAQNKTTTSAGNVTTTTVGTTTNSGVGFKNKGMQMISRWWLRLFLPLSLVLGLEGAMLRI